MIFKVNRIYYDIKTSQYKSGIDTHINLNNVVSFWENDHATKGLMSGIKVFTLETVTDYGSNALTVTSDFLNKYASGEGYKKTPYISKL